MGDELVPMIFMSDGTHLSNSTGDKKVWPVWIKIDNQSSKIRQMPSTRSVIMVALLLFPIKNHNIAQKWLDEQQQTNREVLNEVLRQILQPLTFIQNPSTESGYYNVLCADGNIRCCKLVLAAWLADNPEYSDLHHLEQHVCFWCECPKNEIGDYVPPDDQHPRWEHNLYRTPSDANNMAANFELSLHRVHQGFNVFRHIPCILSDLPMPNLLHTMQICMLEHLQKWIFHCMNAHEWHNKYVAIWLSGPACHDLTPRNKSYEDVSQWNGKEMKEMSRYLLGVVTQSLGGGSPAQHPIFNCAIVWTQALLEYYMDARYESHDDATLSYIEDALHRFHTLKDVFLLRRAGNEVKAKANALRTELMQRQKGDKETHAETRSQSKKRCEMNSWRDYISHDIDISKELDADWNLPKICLISHWAEHIH